MRRAFGPRGSVPAMLAAPMEIVQFVTVGGRRIEVVEHAGSAGEAPLVLLHEGLGSARLWRSFPADLPATTSTSSCLAFTTHPMILRRPRRLESSSCFVLSLGTSSGR